MSLATNCLWRAAAMLRLIIAGIAFVLLLASGARPVVADVSNKIPITVVSTCRDEVGKEIVQRIQDAVSKNVAIFNDGTRQIYLREAASSETRIVMEFGSKAIENLVFKKSNVSIAWYIVDAKGGKRLLHSASYEQSDNVASYRIASNHIIRTTNEVLTAYGVLPK